MQMRGSGLGFKELQARDRLFCSSGLLVTDEFGILERPDGVEAFCLSTSLELAAEGS